LELSFIFDIDASGVSIFRIQALLMFKNDDLEEGTGGIAEGVQLLSEN
jgi:hypothetical protein